MNVDLADRLRQLQGATCSNVDVVEYEPAPSDGIQPIGMAMIFSDGTKVSSTYWRLIKSGKPRVSSFDHRQTSGFQNQSMPSGCSARSCTATCS